MTSIRPGSSNGKRTLKGQASQPAWFWWLVSVSMLFQTQPEKRCRLHPQITTSMFCPKAEVAQVNKIWEYRQPPPAIGKGTRF